MVLFLQSLLSSCVVSELVHDFIAGIEDALRLALYMRVDRHGFFIRYILQ